MSIARTQKRTATRRRTRTQENQDKEQAADIAGRILRADRGTLFCMILKLIGLRSKVAEREVSQALRRLTRRRTTHRLTLYAP